MNNVKEFIKLAEDFDVRTIYPPMVSHHQSPLDQVVVVAPSRNINATSIERTKIREANGDSLFIALSDDLRKD